MGCAGNSKVAIEPMPLIIVKESSEEEKIDLIKGCVIGAFCGDAAGATLEWVTNWTETAVSEALQMNGGGPLRVGKGQVTDDSEMAMCLAHVLAKSEGKLILKNIAAKYRIWLDSNPFGTTNYFKFPK